MARQTSMMGRAFALWLIAVILTAFFVPRSWAQDEIQCVQASEHDLHFGQDRWIMGRGLLADGAQVRLAVNTDRHFLITVQPPGMPVFCVLMIGGKWLFTFPDDRKAQR